MLAKNGGSVSTHPLERWGVTGVEPGGVSGLAGSGDDSRNFMEGCLVPADRRAARARLTRGASSCDISAVRAMID